MAKKSNTSFRQGVYTVQNRAKYIGKKPPIFRSSWERTYMKQLDFDPQIVKWGSECIVISYYFQGKNRRYYPDFIYTNSNGETILVEIKPSRETRPPRKTKKKSRKTMLYEQYTYAKNTNKWEAAKEFCRKKGWKFVIITEKELII
jgi:hypothetical protein